MSRNWLLTNQEPVFPDSVSPALTRVNNFSRSISEGRYDNVESWKREGRTVLSSTMQVYISAGDIIIMGAVR